MRKLLDQKLIKIGLEIYKIQREEMGKPGYPWASLRDPRSVKLKHQHTLLCFLLKLFEVTQESRSRGLGGEK